MTNPIHIYHEESYWTDYVAKVSELYPESFKLIRNKFSDSGYANADHVRSDSKSNPYENLLICHPSGHPFLHGKKKVVRIQHSPGFGFEVFLKYLGWCWKNDVTMMIPKNIWNHMKRAEEWLKVPAKEDLKYLIHYESELLHNHKIAFTEIDPILAEQFHSYADESARVCDTVLIKPNWRIRRTQDNVNILRDVILKLKSEGLKVHTGLHPLTKLEDWNENDMSGLPSSVLIRMIDETGTPWSWSVGHSDLIGQFKKTEFVCSDGSGSLYDGVANGCKALGFSGCSYHKNKGMLEAALNLGLLAETDYTKASSHPGIKSDRDWVLRIHGRSLLHNNPHSIVAQELENLFNAK